VPPPSQASSRPLGDFIGGTTGEHGAEESAPPDSIGGALGAWLQGGAGWGLLHGRSRRIQRTGSAYPDSAGSMGSCSHGAPHPVVVGSMAEGKRSTGKKWRSSNDGTARRRRPKEKKRPTFVSYVGSLQLYPGSITMKRNRPAFPCRPLRGQTIERRPDAGLFRKRPRGTWRRNCLRRWEGPCGSRAPLPAGSLADITLYEDPLHQASDVEAASAAA